MTSCALALYDVNSSGGSLKLFAFALMSNHIHNLLCGSEEDCISYFEKWRARLKRCFAGRIDLSKWKCNMKAVDNLKSFRYEVAYINRNGFVNNQAETPFSYEWSSGRYHFNPVVKEILITQVSNLSFREKREVFRSRVTDQYDSLKVSKGYISPLCFCEISKGEGLYNTAHQYFNFISRGIEEYSLIARSLGEQLFLNDTEMFNVVYRRSKELYKSEPKLLAPEEKIEMARFMHHKYHASNSQIQRILKMDISALEELFPKAQ